MDNTFIDLKDLSKLDTKNGFQTLNLGKRNSKYVHTIIQKKRDINHISKIKLNNGDWCEDSKELVYFAINYFNYMLNTIFELHNQKLPHLILSLIKEEDNFALINIPLEFEIFTFLLL